MSKTLQQIFATNPTTVVADTDLYYLVQSPYTPGTDAAITGLDLKLAFGAGGTINPGIANQIAYYASSGSTISGLTGGNDGTLITGPTGIPSISSTLPTAVQNNITRLGTIVSIGAPLGGTFGGTGVNNGASTITIGGSVSMIGAFTFAGTLTGNTAVTFPTSGTLATTSQLLISPLTTKGDIWVWSTTNDRLPVGTVNGQVLQANSVAATGLSYSTATYPSTATNVARLLRSDATNWVETTSTFADTYAASSVLYANGANNVAGLATANNGLLVTSNTGVPSILAGPGTTGNILQSNAAAAPSFSTATYPSIATGTGTILRADGTNWVPTTATYPSTAGTSGNVLTSDGTNFVSSAPAAQAGRLINVQVFTASGTYTKTTGAVTAIVKLVGSGGGGAGSGSAGGGTGGTPSANTFGAILTANGGAGGVFSAGTGSAGGTASGANIANLQGGAGQALQVNGTSYVLGGRGGNSYFSGGAPSAAISTAGVTAGANTGAGGSGGSGNGSTTAPGSGGGAGGYCEHFWTIASPQTVTLNNGGTAGTAGTSGVAGGAGAKGICIVYEYS